MMINSSRLARQRRKKQWTRKRVQNISRRLLLLPILGSLAVFLTVLSVLGSFMVRTLTPAAIYPSVAPLFVHLVHTRFQQNQPNLLALGRARLLLFQTFCLPTMVAQTTQKFLWIIHTDPHLHHSLRTELVDMLRPYPHFYLIGTNVNMNLDSNQTSWKDGDQGQLLLQSPIYTGDVTLLQQAHGMRNDVQLLLETRLDADDGLHSNYLDIVQSSALVLFTTTEEESSPPPFMYWCSKRHLEWFLGNVIQAVEHSKLCISAGITVGYRNTLIAGGRTGAATAVLVPRYSHDVLYKSLIRDGYGNSCLTFITELPFCAIRSRTPTSAGMKDILVPSTRSSTSSMNKLWNIAKDTFHITSTEQVETYFNNHLVEIAKDNLAGQCTNGHSCKMKAKEELQRLIEQGSIPMKDGLV